MSRGCSAASYLFRQNKCLLENLRPISLLNIDYKILTKTIAKRLEKVLPNVINPNQSGYIKGRFIGENVRLIHDIMYHTKQTDKPGIAIFLDFRKAFDTIEWCYLKKALQMFSFGPGIQKWFDIIYNDASSCVLHNGHASEFFLLEKRCATRMPFVGSTFRSCNRAPCPCLTKGSHNLRYSGGPQRIKNHPICR